MIALIGAGPLGIEMAVALKRAGLPYMHFERGQIGSTIQWWAPGTRWFSSNDRISIAGVPLVTPAQEKATREEYRHHQNLRQKHLGF
jgi:thioredoxin reductase (NADPH)